MGRIQNEILDLEQPPALEPAGVRARVAQALADASLQVHSCHGALRELEVLHDQLLAMLDDDPGLEPEDIVVMAPDIETYAPYVAAVFEREPRLSFNIADRSLMRTSPVAESFIKLLWLPSGRLGASEVLDLLEAEPVAAALDFGQAELELVRRWVTESGIRWGRDELHRAELGLPAERQNSWRAGLERLLMGYAVGGDEFSAGILPYEVEIGQAEVLGRFVDFCNRLCHFAQAAAAPRPLKAWQDFMMKLLDDFFAAGDEAQRLREQFLELGRLAELSGQSVPVGLEVARAWLVERLNASVNAAGFLSGGVTFCSLLPMRSIPFKVVCLLGMNHDGFPRRQRSSGFDLIARHPRRGDRSKRDDDLYLFLETILAARQRLYLSYVGQSPQGGAKLPPSVLVSELLDYCGLDEGFIGFERLQAFSPAYFDGSSRLFSYSQANLAGARALINPPPAAAAEWPLSEPEPSFRSLSLADLSRFYRNACAYLLERRLGARRALPAELPDDREPFEIEGLQAFSLKRELLHCAGSESEARLRAMGLLPHGPRGTELCRALTGELGELAARVAAYGEPATATRLELELAGFSLNASLELCAGDVLVQSRPGSLRASDRFELWLKLLALAADGRAARGVLLGLEGGRVKGLAITAPAEAGSLLAELLELYWQGLRQPLGFFARASEAYAAAWLKDPDKALAAARASFENDRSGPAESADWAVRRCFAGRDPLGGEFAELALRIWRPLISQEVKLA